MGQPLAHQQWVLLGGGWWSWGPLTASKCPAGTLWVTVPCPHNRTVSVTPQMPLQLPSTHREILPLRENYFISEIRRNSLHESRVRGQCPQSWGRPLQ